MTCCLEMDFEKSCSLEEGKKIVSMNKEIGVADQSSESSAYRRSKKRKHAERKKKKSGAKLKNAEDGVNSIDMISQLPEHVIHHILSLLRCAKNVARMSTLSKKWNDIYRSYYVLDIDERKFQLRGRRLWRYGPKQATQKIETESHGKKSLFIRFVNDMLLGRSPERSSIQKFKLHLKSIDWEQVNHLDRWIKSATESSIRELDIHVPNRKNGIDYLVPVSVFFMKKLSVLRLTGFNMNTCNEIELPNLRKLSLGKLCLPQQILNNLLHRCPLLEDLRLICCSGSKELLASSDHLSRVDLHLCYELKIVELQAPRLHTFWYHGKRSIQCQINLLMCNSLKSLTLEHPRMKDNVFQDWLSSFPVLEHLRLSNCSGLKRITISCHQLKSLILSDCGNLRCLGIDAPNLVSFEYKDHNMPFAFDPSRLREAKLYFRPSKSTHDSKMFSKECTPGWFIKLQEFMRKFDELKGLKLVVRYKENAIVHEELRAMLIPPSDDLKLDMIKPTVGLEDVVDNVLQTWHPETLTIVSSRTSNVPKEMHKKMLHAKKGPGCCKYNSPSRRCWRHFLKGVFIEDLRDNETATGLNASLTSSTSKCQRSHGDTETEADWIEWLKSSASRVDQMTIFRLNWQLKRT